MKLTSKYRNADSSVGQWPVRRKSTKSNRSTLLLSGIDRQGEKQGVCRGHRRRGATAARGRTEPSNRSVSASTKTLGGTGYGGETNPPGGGGSSGARGGKKE